MDRLEFVARAVVALFWPWQRPRPRFKYVASLPLLLNRRRVRIR